MLLLLLFSVILASVVRIFFPSIVILEITFFLYAGEDRYCTRVTGDIFTAGVYDGHGGYLAADIASATLQDMIIADILNLDIEERSNIKIAEIIDAAFITCDNRIIAEALRLHRASKLQIANQLVNDRNTMKTYGNQGTSSSTSATTATAINNINNATNKTLSTPKVMGRAGSCAVVVVITGGVLFVAHVG